jgi:hypothetical protein
MSTLTAAQVMTDKSNHRMLVKEGKSAKSMSSTKMWSKSNTSNKITSHGEGIVETEYGLCNKFCCMCVSEKVLWVMAMYHLQESEKAVKIYGSPRFRRVRIVTLITQVRLLFYCGYVHRAGKPCCHFYHITDAIESTDCEIFWWDSFHYHFGKNIEYTRTTAHIINSKKLGIPYTPNVKSITQPVYTNCHDSFIFEYIMQIPIQILVTGALPVRKGVGSSSEYSADGFEVHFNSNFSEYELMAIMQYKETKKSQELKLGPKIPQRK